MSRRRNARFAHIATSEALQFPGIAGATGMDFSQRYREMGNSGWT